MRLQGSRAAERERVAVHESGHAIAAVALGVEVVEANILNCRTSDGALICEAFMDPRIEVLVRLAGLSAEMLAFGEANESRARDDLANARFAAFEATGDLINRDKLIAEGKSRVRELLTKHWHAVNELAIQLLRGPGWLDAAEIEAIFRPLVIA